MERAFTAITREFPGVFDDFRRRCQLCRQLILKQKPHHNKPVHKALYVRLISCHKPQFVEAMQIIAQAETAVKRNTELCTLFQLVFANIIISDSDEALVREIYEQCQ